MKNPSFYLNFLLKFYKKTFLLQLLWKFLLSIVWKFLYLLIFFRECLWKVVVTTTWSCWENFRSNYRRSFKRLCDDQKTCWNNLKLLLCQLLCNFILQCHWNVLVIFLKNIYKNKFRFSFSAHHLGFAFGCSTISSKIPLAIFSRVSLVFLLGFFPFIPLGISLEISTLIRLKFLRRDFKLVLLKEFTKKYQMDVKLASIELPK